MSVSPKTPPVPRPMAFACLLTLTVLLSACGNSPEPVGAVVVAPTAKPAPAPAAVRMYEPPSPGPLTLWNSSKKAATERLNSDNRP